MTQPADKDHFNNLISSLKQQRDELALKIHLAEMEAKQEFDKAQEKLAQVSADYEPLQDAVGESAEKVWESLKLVAGEVSDSFERIRKAL